MKGTLKTLQAKPHLQKKTNFNDWSDPKSKVLKKTSQIHIWEQSKDSETKGDETDNKKLLSIVSETTLEINELRKKIKDGYPLLTQKEIRIIKLPYYESLLLNILEDGFVATHKFIKDLIDMDEARHGQRDGSSNKKLPFLKSNITALNFLCSGLTKAEIEKLERNKDEELRLLLEMAMHFSKPEEASWHWLSAELYEQCIAVFDDTETCAYEIDKELKAISQYLYASFLLDTFLDPKRAKPLVEESMKLSEGKLWKAGKITGQESDILYLESCFLLHKIYLVMAHDLKERDIEESIQMCRHSLYWAKQINCKEAEATALLNLVIIYIKARIFDLVLSYLENFMSICFELQDVNGLCEGYILKAEYHKEIGEDDLVITDIQELLKVAEDNKILQMMAIAHHKLAVFHLTQGNKNEMLHHAAKAYKYYVVLNSKDEIDEARSLTGVTKALEIMPQYLSLLPYAEEIDSVELKIIMLWKTLHIPFFSNVKMFHPEASVNEDLKDKMEALRNEEIKAAYRARQTEMMATMSMIRVPSKINAMGSTAGSLGSKMSRGVLDFQRQMRSEADITTLQMSSQMRSEADNTTLQMSSH